MIAAWVADPQLHRETIELSFWQRIRPMLLDRVLGGDHEEGIGEDVPHVVDGDLTLRHRFQERTLSAWGGAVDLVRQQNVGKHWTGHKLEFASGLVEHAKAGDVAGEQVGRALDPRETFRLGLVPVPWPASSCPGPASLHEQVPARQQAGQHVFDHVGLAPKGMITCGPNSVDRAGMVSLIATVVRRHRPHVVAAFPVRLREIWARKRASVHVLTANRRRFPEVVTGRGLRISCARMGHATAQSARRTSPSRAGRSPIRGLRPTTGGTTGEGKPGRTHVAGPIRPPFNQ